MAEGFSRRSFIKLAATAGAAAAIPGCQPAARKLIPYVVPDENVIPGVPTFYATTCDECSAGCGIIAKVREGRVIKLEGNPARPHRPGRDLRARTGGLQGLYNPDRLRSPMLRGADGKLTKISWDDALKQFADHLKEAAGKGNDRVAMIASPQGPTLQKITTAFLGAYKSNRATYYEAISDEPAREASQMVFGRRDLPSYRIDQAEVLISFGADFLETWRSPIELARQYAEFRAPKNRNGALTIGRAIYVGPRFNMTAAKCDEWIASPAGAEAMLALAILHVILAQGWVGPNSGVDVAALKNFAASYDPASVSQKTGVPADRISKIAERFGKADGALALAGGDDPTLHAAAYILNAATGNLGRTMQFYEGEPPEIVAKSDDVAAAIEKIRIGIVATSTGAAQRGGQPWISHLPGSMCCVIAGGNPLYSMPPAWRTDEAFKKVPFVVWAGTVPDESADARASAVADSSSAGIVARYFSARRRARPRAAGHATGLREQAARRCSHRPRKSERRRAAAVERHCRCGQDRMGEARGGATDANEFWIKSLTEGGIFSDADPGQGRAQD